MNNRNVMAKMAKKESESSMDQVLSTVPAPLPIEDMPLNSLEEYRAYNAEARRMNKKLRICRYPIKQCPIELHPKERIVFGRVDQPANYAPIYLSNDDIEFKQKLYPGKTYDLPRVVIDFLASKGTPIWAWFDNPDGSKETRISHRTPRFALRTIYQD